MIVMFVIFCGDGGGLMFGGGALVVDGGSGSYLMEGLLSMGLPRLVLCNNHALFSSMDTTMASLQAAIPFLVKR